MYFRGLLTFLVLLCANCENKNSDIPPLVLEYLALDYVISQDPDRSAVYFSTVRNMGVEIAYEDGAAPFAGNFTVSPSISVWSVTKSNLEDVFADRSYTVTVNVPDDLSSMTQFPNQGRTSWSINQLLGLVTQYRTESSNFESTSFFVVFVNGHLGGSPGVIGVTVSGVLGLGAPTVFLFKEVINNFNDTFSPDKVKKAEQMTVTHELGHALGLVNAGIPMFTSHQDTEHGSHCTNTSCGMYWALSDTKVNSFSPVSPLILGQECIDDIRNYKP